INLADTTADTVILKNDDQVNVYSTQNPQQQLAVYVHGEVQKPGKYRWHQNLHIADLIQMAHGLTRGAYLPEGELACIDPVQPARILKFNLAEILDNPNSPMNFQLQPDDAVFIRTIPDWQVGPTITISGEVEFPGPYAISRDSTLLSHIVQQAGGFTSRAMLPEASVTRRRLNLIIDKEYERLKAIPRDQLTDDEYDYLVMKQNHQDVHRINVNFFQLFREKNTAEDIILRDGDEIRVPEKPRVIQVTGRVSTPGGVLYVPAQNLAYYLEKAGGTTWDAKTRKTKITRANGEIVSCRKIDKIAPGDIIWVPRKKHRDWWVIFRDTMLITTQVATVWLIIENIQK
ncbi:SLBB domain-containing protein, partial [bacterium]|nr:SLBB domain-containing protein [bacterium]